jgi:hypothetical protein
MNGTSWMRSIAAFVDAEIVNGLGCSELNGIERFDDDRRWNNLTQGRSINRRIGISGISP